MAWGAIGRSVRAREVTVRDGSLTGDHEGRMTMQPGRARGSLGGQGQDGDAAVV